VRGGRPRQLTHNLVRDSWPTWSPDGTRIALARGGVRFESRIFVMNANGTHARMLTRGGLDVQPAWSPDGTRIAFVRRISSCDRSGELVVTTLRDGRETALACGVSAPAWSPDAKRIGASHETDCPTFATTPPCFDLLIVTPAKGTTSERELPGLGFGVGPRWSPDGKEVTVGGDWQPLCTHSGTRRAQLLLGTSKTDVICGFGGNDLIDGNAGHDVLYGGSGNDLIIDQSGRDWLFGGPGRDRLRARDGAADIVDCGPGRDVAIVDRRDVVSHCEVVRRG
jgi:dipeptidyl aminopeptidase/acylaminoacyl peptidase